VVAVRRRDRTVWFVLGLVVGALVLAVMKPWGLGSPTQPAAGTTGSAVGGAGTTRPAPSSTEPPGPANCYNNEAYRLVTAERTLGRDIRSWIAVEPVPATQPDDARIPTLSIVSGRLLGLGLCGPRVEGVTAGADESTVLWVPPERSAQASVRVMDLVRLEPLDEFGSGEGQLYKPPVDYAGPDRSWPNGRYVMELGQSGGGSFWFAFLVSSAPATPPRTAAPSR
jgi:hypothetical protein